jgi:arylsulfatase A-like enzyme
MEVADLSSYAAGEPAANVLIVTFEATRADHVGAYGYSRDTTPGFDRFAAQGALFRHYYVMVPRTTPSTAAIMSSLHPITSGVRTNRDMLEERYLTLAEILKRYGYQTASTMTGQSRGMAQGFDRLIEPQGANATRLHAVRWLRAHRDQPFFLWIHHRDEAHGPYRPPPPYDTMFEPSLDRAAAHELQGRVARRETSLREFYLEMDYPDSIRKQMIALYDGEIRYADDETARIMEELDRLDLTDRTIVVWSADHGEALCDHGLCWEHGELAYDDTLHVPLAIRHPPLIEPGTVVRHPSQALDLAPTILDMLGLPVHEEMEGCSLLPVLRGDRDEDPERLLYLEAGGNLWSGDRFRSLPGNAGKPRVVRNQRWKLILTPGRDPLELYDVETDPRETTNLIDAQPEIAERLGEALRAWMSRPQRELDSPISPEHEERLRQLGYIQ